MQSFRSEFAHSYSNHSFGYCNYIVREEGDALANIYAQGYLPYSDTKVAQGIFYMARSARIYLSRFKLNSENRRITKRFDGVFTFEVTPLPEFSYMDDNFLMFCLEYFSKRHGPKVMSEDRLKCILKSGFVSHITIYKKGEEVVAYVFEVGDEKMTHYWFSFYDLQYVYQSLGMWLMIDAARRAKQDKKKFFYLGTV